MCPASAGDTGQRSLITNHDPAIYGGDGRGYGVNAGVAWGVVVEVGTGRGNGVGRGDGVGFTPSKSALGRAGTSRGGRVGRGCGVIRGRGVGG
jgi:hypothetical protein